MQSPTGHYRMRITHGRDKQNRYPAPCELVCSHGSLDSVHFRHINIHNDQIRKLIVFQIMQCLFSAFTENDGILILENSTHGIQIGLHIIYDHDFFSGSFLNHLLSFRLFRIWRNRIKIFRWKNRNI